MRAARRIALAALTGGLAIVLAVPGEAFALFSAAPAAPAVPVTAAAIGAPSGVTATATSSTSATLSWTAPATYTGYTLSQSAGTLAGCSATPSAATTSCTATGLSPGTAYTWTLTAVYNNWKSSPATASATTPAVVGASLLRGATDSTSGSMSSSVFSVTTTRGADLLILVYRQASSSTLGVSSVSGTAISGTPALVTSKAFGSPATYELWAYRATGTGTWGGTVTVTFSAANNDTTVIDVVQLSGDQAGSPVTQAAGSAGWGTTAAGAALTGASSQDGEVFFAGLAASTTMSTPSGYSALDAPAYGASAVRGAWFSSAASASGISTRLGASGWYGTIEIEINNG
jgi:large repetitive protein